jgi:DNA-binding transcriptional MerR regulator
VLLFPTLTIFVRVALQERILAATEELIETHKVAEILGMSIATLRDYRKRGLIVVAAKRGNTDLYDKVDVVRRHSIIREKRRQGFSLSQISGMLAKEPVNVINLPGPQEPAAEMSSQELLHGFLAELYRNAGPETKDYINELGRKWNVHYKTQVSKG